jgi:hypothetical protein
MADKFRVALSGDFKKADGCRLPDFDLAPLAEPGVEAPSIGGSDPRRRARRLPTR